MEFNRDRQIDANKKPRSSRVRFRRTIRDGGRWGERLPDDHLAKIVERQVNQFDREALDQVYRGSGSLPDDPILLLKMVLDQYLTGNLSAARWLEEAERNEAMQWLGRGCVPARRTWYEFRDRAGKFIEQVHQQIIAGALDEELLDPTVGVQEGTAVAAHIVAFVSHIIMSYCCDPAHCRVCPLAAKCLRPNAASRTVKRLEGQELLDAQRKKMASPEVQSRYRLRGQTVELAFADIKGNRQRTRFHGRGPSRARSETGLMVLAQNLLRLDRLEKNPPNRRAAST